MIRKEKALHCFFNALEAIKDTTFIEDYNNQIALQFATRLIGVYLDQNKDPIGELFFDTLINKYYGEEWWCSPSFGEICSILFIEDLSMEEKAYINLGAINILNRIHSVLNRL